ncbi:MAG: hypothetical protein IT463_14985 [Planctomycetes bacterium]|nr:hypothetical protein [Planctomycetota bacterium]
MASKRKAAPNPQRRPAPDAEAGKALAAVWKRFRDKGDVEARNALVEHYFDMVRANSENVATIIIEAVEQNDLQQTGVVGFFEALNAYDPARHGTFEEFGSAWIRRSMADELCALIGVEDARGPRSEEE